MIDDPLRWIAALLLASALAAGCRPAGPPPHPEGRWFVEKGCNGCHTIQSLDVRGARPTGAPDLSAAVVDVQSRFGVTIEEFMRAPPSGTMAMVLSTQIRLSQEQRAEAARRLHRAHEEHLARLGAPRTP